MTRANDADGTRLPIKLDSTTNGEFAPSALSPAARAANQLAHGNATGAARRLGLSRRKLLTSACGAAGTLLAMNEAFAGYGRTGGFYDLPGEAALDLQLAQAAVGGDEFIFDVQGHHVNPHGAWRDKLISQWNLGLRFMPQAGCSDAEDTIACFSAEHFIREVFLDSDTDLCVLSMVPAAPADNPLSIDDAAATRAMVDVMEGDHRLMIHGLVHPQLPGAIDGMEAQLSEYRIAAWKTYTQWGPDRVGYWLHDETYGLPMIEKARALGVKTICVHKGLPLPGILFDQDYASARDIGVVARLYPDVTFIVYHSGYEQSREEKAYLPGNPNPSGVDTLIESLLENNIAPGSNVYAELGSTWRHVMQDPDQAAHLLGKLLKYVGEDRVLWGTDSIWYGSPQDQIQAMRTFQISERFREQYDYPEITPEIRAKIFGLNAANGPYRLDAAEIRKRAADDTVHRVKQTYLETPDPSFQTYGPKTRREFMRLMRLTGGRPA